MTKAWTPRVASFVVALFLSAALLFSVQPMIGRMLLPALGGTPAVWTTCMVFFQALLLGGYAYAHASTRFLHLRHQLIVHAALLVLAAAVLPHHLDSPDAEAAARHPTLTVVWLLLRSTGLPFFVLSATAPLLQRWLTLTSDGSAQDPYFLSIASNAGSLVGLFLYPLWVEPTFGLKAQALGWAGLYGLLAAALALCGAMAWRARVATEASTGAHEPLTALARAQWLGLAIIPTSLMMAVTTGITTDLVAVPLLWAIPLGLYLISFIVAFATQHPLLRRVLTRAVPVLIALTVFGATSGAWSVVTMVGLHFVTLFAIALLCHLELARSRPKAQHLTEFYVWISVGGVVGGVFNALVAPTLFTTVLELPISLAAAGLALPVLGSADGRSWRVRWLDAGAVALAVAGLTWVAARLALTQGATLSSLGAAIGTSTGALRTLIAFGVPSALLVGLARWPLRLGLAVLAFWVANGLATAKPPLFRERSFFGVLTVVKQDFDRSHVMIHGSTHHGKQYLERPAEPTYVYERSSPVGDVMARLDPGPLAVIGLGAGTLAAYAAPGQQVTFFEIDPLVREAAEDPRLFTFLADARRRGVSIDVRLGDARQRLAERDERFATLVVDAFSSDVIPVHLLTLEAVQLYLQRLEPHGLLVVNLSNRHFDLAPVLARIASELGLSAALKRSVQDSRLGRSTSSTWMVLTRDRARLEPLVSADPLTPWSMTPSADAPLWTDDRSSPMAQFDWSR